MVFGVVAVTAIVCLMVVATLLGDGQPVGTWLASALAAVAGLGVWLRLHAGLRLAELGLPPWRVLRRRPGLGVALSLVSVVVVSAVGFVVHNLRLSRVGWGLGWGPYGYPPDPYTTDSGVSFVLVEPGYGPYFQLDAWALAPIVAAALVLMLVAELLLVAMFGVLAERVGLTARTIYPMAFGARLLLALAVCQLQFDLSVVLLAVPALWSMWVFRRFGTLWPQLVGHLGWVLGVLLFLPVAVLVGTLALGLFVGAVIAVALVVGRGAGRQPA